MSGVFMSYDAQFGPSKFPRHASIAKILDNLEVFADGKLVERIPLWDVSEARKRRPVKHLLKDGKRADYTMSEAEYDRLHNGRSEWLIAAEANGGK